MVAENRAGIRNREDLLGYVHAYVDERGYPPSVREIARAVGISPTTVHYHLHVLHRQGAIELTPGIARGIRVVGT